MDDMISGYYCNEHGEIRGYLGWLQTGNIVASSKQSGYCQKHTYGKPSSRINGVLLDPRREVYEAGGRQIGQSGFVEIEANGGVNAYLQFSGPFAEMQYSGTASGVSSLGKAVLINNPICTHWYAVTGYGLLSGICADCGVNLF